MIKLLEVYGVILITLVVGDAIWISFFGKKVFQPTVGDAALKKPRWAAAIAFYLMYAAAIITFPIALAIGGTSESAAVCGAAFGFVCYMTYDLTNLATLKPWTLKLAAADVGWGTFLTGLATFVGFESALRFG